MDVKAYYILYFWIILLLPYGLLSQKSNISIDSAALSNRLIEISAADSLEILDLLEETKSLYRESPAEGILFLTRVELALEKNKENSFKGEILLIKGNFYWNIGIYNIALNNYFEALSYFERINNKQQVIKLLNNIGETYKKQKNYILAQQFLHTAIQKSKGLQRSEHLLIDVNMAQLHVLMQNNDSALAILLPIVHENRVTESTGNAIAYANLYLGIINKELKNYDSADYYLRESLNFWQAEKLHRNTAETLAELANLNIVQGNYYEAKKTLNLAEFNAKEAHAMDILMRVYQYQIALIENSRINDSLSYFYKKYVEVKDSIYNEESRKEINKLTIQYDLLEKEKDNYKLALDQEKLENENENQRALLIVLVFILILAIISVYLQIIKRQQLSKAHITLKNQKADIESKQRQLSQKSLDLANVNQELYNLNRTLEQKVIKRSEQLNIKNKQIAEYTFYNSHKLRAPVASILGLINVLELNKEGKIDLELIDHLKTCAVELDLVIHKLKILLDSELIDELSNEEN